MAQVTQLTKAGIPGLASRDFTANIGSATFFAGEDWSAGKVQAHWLADNQKLHYNAKDGKIYWSAKE